ncbi:hypothetical protein [Iningainema tapete]|uniref:Uncharacterized protein n=1 Tax=Iningainema tapete BLCC-T55 TaxID=2748662 RepID=A0A8J6XD18_9CYAN|nr:hypothetical protein [Iningainema tapete]MBD2770963.1 hypothetical protein [Iningainema tapete BLCC-T55]
MMDCTLLNRKFSYRIMGKPEIYHFSHVEGEFRRKRYVFWRISKTNPNKRVNISRSSGTNTASSLGRDYQ